MGYRVKTLANPFEELRKQRGMSRRDLAIVLGVSYFRVYEHETGLVNKPQPTMLKPLKALNVDVDKLCADYTAWREEQRKALLA